ncbi:MAG: MoxR family ATPase [Gammaproteobacteria bacterium]|nr:MoxR family ATPase [Gammaproteobacteria bacterium]NNF66739.1 MoxR family ATPase [Gammaproteobacteria bacterium]
MTTTQVWPQRSVAESSEALETIVQQLGQVILGKENQLRLCVACLLARGHLLIEDIPGVGKTTLAHALAHTLGLSYHRIQFTSDLLPADILGVSIYDRDDSDFRFHPGPIFSQLVLADEINRATPKTQSALLEAMEETQVSADGNTHALPEPFFVVATQNPSYQIGTFPLPESQLDRFLMRIELGYPGADVEKELLTGRDRRDVVAGLKPCISNDALLSLQQQVPQMHVSDALIQYVQDIVAFTRESSAFATGLSPRAAIVLLRAAQAWALMEGHRGVLPEDVQAVGAAVIGHRLRPRDESAPQSANEIGQFVVKSVPIP